MLSTFFLAFLQFFAPANASLAPSIGSLPASAGQTVFTLRVEQKKKNVQIVEHEVTLKKKFFDLVFELNQPGGIAVLASLDSTIFKQAASGMPAKDILGFEHLGGGGGMAEAPLNPAQELMIGKGGFNYWYYDNRTDNRFNRTVRKTDLITCYRTVGKVQLLDTKESFEIGDALSPLYLVFAQPDGSQVDYLKINWK